MRLEQYISDNSLSVSDFACLINVKSRATIHRYIKGRIPKPEVLERIIAATKGAVTANDFYNLKHNRKRSLSKNIRKVKKN